MTSPRTPEARPQGFHHWPSRSRLGMAAASGLVYALPLFVAAALFLYATS